MKKRLSKYITLFIIIVLIITIFFNSNKLMNIVLFSINVFIKNVFPSLFPMFIISSVLVELNVPYYLGKFFRRPMSFLFKGNSFGSFVFFMSMLTGFPSSAKYINDLMEKDLITKKDSEKILMFTFFSNPLFIINTVGNMFFKSTMIGLYMFISHLFGNIITGIFFRGFNKSKKNPSYIQQETNNIFNTLSISIKESLEIMINIFGILTFFLIIINIVFSTPDNFIKIFISGLFEMTSGLKYLSLSNLSLNTKLYLSMFFISFGGFSIHFQIFSILKKRKVKYLPFLISRIIHSLTSIILLFILLKLDMLF